jgi:hypothetical protein
LHRDPAAKALRPNNRPQMLRPNVRDGSDSEVRSRSRRVRSTPTNGRRAARLARGKCSATGESIIQWRPALAPVHGAAEIETATATPAREPGRRDTLGSDRQRAPWVRSTVLMDGVAATPAFFAPAGPCRLSNRVRVRVAVQLQSGEWLQRRLEAGFFLINVVERR